MIEAYEKILSIDIGGTSIKAATLDRDGKLQQEYKKLPTPSPATPEHVLTTIKELVKDFTYDKIAAGFPGYVKKGIIHTAPNLGTDAWANINLAKRLNDVLGKPARVINDADM